MRTLGRGTTLIAAGVLMLGAWSMGWGQQQNGAAAQAVQPPTPTAVPFGDDSIATPPSNMVDDMARQRNTTRQKKLVEDTNKLLRLATQLKVEVDQSDKNALSVDVVKKADEIEKLARSVKDGMKGE